MLGSSIARVIAPQLPGFISALADTPKVQLRFMKQELGRGLKRIRKTFIRTQLQGPPGIHAGSLAKGKNIFTFAGGESRETLVGKIGISRILHVHEKGMTIEAKPGNTLYIHEKGTRRITAVAKRVTIPSRLRFKELVEHEAPAVFVKVGEAGKRAAEVQLKKGLLGRA